MAPASGVYRCSGVCGVVNVTGSMLGCTPAIIGRSRACCKPIVGSRLTRTCFVHTCYCFLLIGGFHSIPLIARTCIGSRTRCGVPGSARTRVVTRVGRSVGATLTSNTTGKDCRRS